MEPTVRRPARTALLHVRLLPDLRTRIDADAESRGLKPSAVVRRILEDHYEAAG